MTKSTRSSELQRRPWITVCFVAAIMIMVANCSGDCSSNVQFPEDVLDNLFSEMNQYIMESGYYPVINQFLNAVVQSFQVADLFELLRIRDPFDLWGNSFQSCYLEYLNSDGCLTAGSYLRYSFICRGPDGQLGTEDDVSLPNVFDD